MCRKVLLNLFILSFFSTLVFAKTKLVVFHAGSLTVPFMKIEKAFEKENPNVDVLRVVGGSRKLARMIADVGKYADVYASADYTLINDMLIPEFADKNFKFASNEMVICYTDKSKFHKKINSSNWYKIIMKKGVKYGHSDPNLDPCGYRTILLLKLAQRYYKIKDFFKKITSNREKIIIRPKETDLTPLLEEGFIDYLFIYKSIAVQHHFNYIQLPDKINLSKLKYNSFYSSVKVKLAGKKPGEFIYKKGKAIIYGITYLKNSKHPLLAKKFVDFVLNRNKGGKIIKECGQNFIYQEWPESSIKCRAIYGSGKNIFLLATGSPGELGLLKQLALIFNRAHNSKMCWIKAGSGKSLKLLKSRKVDAVMVHAPNAEKEAIKEGWAINRTLIGSNEFFIVGPKEDPAKIKKAKSVIDAYRRIAKTKSKFFSRGDNSGTNKKELYIWRLAKMKPYEKEWYIVTHDFMMATLLKADKENGYFMTDSSTWYSAKDKIRNLKVLFKDDPLLVNVYHGLCASIGATPSQKLGCEFIRFLKSNNAQKLLKIYGKEKFGKALYNNAKYAKKYEH